MGLQQLLRAGDEVVEQVGGLLGGEAVTVSGKTADHSSGGGRTAARSGGGGAYQQGAPRLVGVIVRGCTDNVLVAALDDEQVAVLYAGDETDTLAAQLPVDGLGQVLIEIINEHAGILCLQVAAVVGQYLVVLQRDDVAAQGQVVVGHLVADGCCLKGAAPFVDLVEVVAQNGRVGHLRAWLEAVGYGSQASGASHPGQHVHIGCLGILQQRPSSQALHTVVGHAVTKDYYSFHS